MPYFTKYFCSYKLNKDHALLINTLTNAIDIVDNKLINEINNVIKNEGKFSQINKEEFDKLKQRGYIFNSLDEEKFLLKKYQAMNDKILSNLDQVVYWTICPSMECNLACPYCYEISDQNKAIKRLSIKQLNVIFNYILNQKHNKKTKILIFGGEPLLKANYEIIEKILKFGQMNNFQVGITTNGTTLNSEYLKLLSKYRNNLSVQITFDGDKNEHNKKKFFQNGQGTFDVICDNVSKLLINNIKVSIRINVDKQNVQSLDGLKNLFYEKKWNKYPHFGAYAAPVRMYCKNETTLKDSELLDIMMKNNWYNKSFIANLNSAVFDKLFNFFNINQKNSLDRLWNVSYCVATRCNHYCFTANGTISTCLRCAGDENYNIGRFDEKSVTIDKDKLGMWKNRNPFKMEKCKNCKFILLCGGGCAKSSISKYKNINCEACNDIENTLRVFVKHNKNEFLKKALYDAIK